MRSRSRSNLLVPLALALAGCQAGGSATPSAPPSPVVVTATATVAPPSSPPLPSPAAPSPAPRPNDPVDLVVAFVDALAEADERRAFDLLTPAAQASIGGLDGWSAWFAEYAEGLGAYGRPAELSARAIDLPDAEVTIVELSATVTREGDEQFDVAALPVRPQDGGFGIDLLPDFEPVEFRPPLDAEIAPEAQLGAFVPDDVRLALILDGVAVDVESASSGEGTGTGAYFVPGAPLEPGLHSLTAVTYDPGRGADVAVSVYSVE